jgi:hypothetical protein
LASIASVEELATDNPSAKMMEFHADAARVQALALSRR